MTGFDTSFKAREGVHHFGAACMKYKYYFREVLHHDRGIDGEIELPSSAATEGPIIGVQIKSRSDVHLTKNQEYSITVTQRVLEYWNNYGRPVILILYINDDQPIYWARVDNLTNRTIHIPKNNTFDEMTFSIFPRIINEFYNQIARKRDIKEVSQILGEFDFGLNITNIINPIEEALIKAEVDIHNQLFREAEKTYEALCHIFKNNCLLHYNRGMLLLHLDKIDEAFEVADDLYRVFPNRYESLELLGSAFASNGRYDHAVEKLKSALELNPEADSVWNQLGLLHYWTGEYNSSIQMYKKSLELRPDHVVYFNMGLCFTAMALYKEALISYERSIEINTEFHDAYNNRGLVLKDLWRLDEAIRSFEEAIIVRPDSVQALRNLGDLLKDLGRNDEAIEYYRYALNITPEDDSLHLGLGLLYCRKNQLDQAEYHFKNFYKVFADNDLNLSNDLLNDLGYEVAFMIVIERSSGVPKIVEVNDVSELALFNSVPLTRELVSEATINKSTELVTPPIASEDLKKELEIKKQIKSKKVNKTGFWIFGATKQKKDNSWRDLFGAFNIYDQAYFNKLKKETHRRVGLKYELEDNEIRYIEIENQRYQIFPSTIINKNNLVKISFEYKAYQATYFRINFNGYYIAGTIDAEDASFIPFLSEIEVKRMNITLRTLDESLNRIFYIEFKDVDISLV